MSDTQAITKIRIMETLGAPLMAVAEGTAETDDPKIAARMAELLARTVQLSISLGDLMDVRNGGLPDSVRLALAALAAQLVSGHYRESGKAPGDNESKRFAAAMGAVLAFSDNFTQGADNALRLEALEAGNLPFDDSQIVIQYMNAFIPVINAVAAFPFGRQETKLIQEVTQRLVETAAVLRTDMIGGPTGPTAARHELGIIKALTALYVECHRAETERLMAMSENDRLTVSQESSGVLSMDPVWKNFETRVSMLEIVSDAITDLGSGGGSSVNPMPSATAQPAKENPKPAAPAPERGPEQEKASGNYNPMAFFKPGTKDSDAGKAEE